MQFNPYDETWERPGYYLHGVLENPTSGKFSDEHTHSDVSYIKNLKKDVTVLVNNNRERELYDYVKQLIQNYLTLTVPFLVH